MFAINDILEFRAESLETSTQLSEDAKRAAIRAANLSAADSLLEAERDYWRAFLARAESEDDARHAIKHLDELAKLEGRSRG
jgi:hypothetical protein